MRDLRRCVVTDAQLLAWQHRVIVNMAGCTCKMEWKHSAPQPLCEKCMIVEAYLRHIEQTQ